MLNTSKQIARITVIIRSVNKISIPADSNIRMLSLRVNQILVLFSGTEEEYISVLRKYEQFEAVNIVWTYSFGYLEPIYMGVWDQIRNPWLMIMTDRDVLSDSFLESLNKLTENEVDGYMAERIITHSKANKPIPSWLNYYLKPGFKHNYMPVLYKKESVRISEVIHTLYKIIGKAEFLNPLNYYISRNYTTKDMESIRTFVDHWVEKEKRYIFIEMFETRKSRAGAICKILTSIPFLRGFHFKKSHGKLLSLELSKIEYYIFELIRSLSMGYMGLNAYQKVKLETIKKTRKINSVGFATSEFLRCYNSGIINFLNMESSVVDSKKTDFLDMVVVQDSEVSFIRHLLKRFKENDNRWYELDIDGVIHCVQSSLENNINKYMPKQ